MNPANFPVASPVPYMQVTELRALVKRYSHGYGQDRIKDFGWWSLRQHMTMEQKVEVFDYWCVNETD